MKAVHERLFVNFLISLSVRTGNHREECSIGVQSPFEGDENVLPAEIDGKEGKHKSEDCVPRAKLVLAKRFYKRNIGKRKFYLFKQYINRMLSSKSSEKSRAFGHPLSTTLNNARHLSSNV